MRVQRLKSKKPFARISWLLLASPEVRPQTAPNGRQAAGPGGEPAYRAGRVGPGLPATGHRARLTGPRPPASPELSRAPGTNVRPRAGGGGGGKKGRGVSGAAADSP